MRSWLSSLSALGVFFVPAIVFADLAPRDDPKPSPPDPASAADLVLPLTIIGIILVGGCLLVYRYMGTDEEEDEEEDEDESKTDSSEH